MPTYSFLNTETGEEYDLMMKISEREEYLKTNQHIVPVVSAPSIVSGVSTSTQHRVPNGFKEVLAKVAEAHPASNLANKVGGKSIKQVKSEQVVKKHIERVNKRNQTK